MFSESMNGVTLLNKKVLVLNQNYEPLSLCNVKRAINLLYLRKAETVYEYNGKVLRSERVVFSLPSIIRLNRYIKFRPYDVPLNKKNILRRDGSTCQYCGAKDKPMTTDHVIPKTRGGKDTWTNLVCACLACNNKKGDRTPKEAGMRLMRKPKKPTKFHILFSKSKLPDKRWKPFLFLE